MVAPAWRPRPEGWRRQPASCSHSRSGTPPDRSSRHLKSRVEICFPTRNSSNPGEANESKLDFCLVMIRVVTGFKLRFFTAKIANFFVDCYGSHNSRLLGGFKSDHGFKLKLQSLFYIRSIRPFFPRITFSSQCC
jgi:hypothetical protein